MTRLPDHPISRSRDEGTVTPELLDTDRGSAAEIAGSLADLRMFNRWFGGVATTCHLVRHIARRTGAKQLSPLDAGGASGDVPKSVMTVTDKKL